MSRHVVTADAGLHRRAVEVARGSARRVRSGLQDAAAGEVRTAAVGDAADVAAAAVAAVRGADLVLLVEDRDLAARLLDDLRRLGGVEHLAGPAPAGVTGRDVLSEEERRLLDVLARGGSVADAARELALSARTAARRLASARRALGAATNAEAVARSR